MLKIVKAVAVLKLNKETKNGLIPIYFRITHHGISKFMNTGFKCKLNEWDKDKREVIRSVPNSIMINACLRREIVMMEAEILKCNMVGRVITLKSIKNTFQGKGSDYNFYKVCEDMIAEFKSINGYSVPTNLTYVNNVTALKKFMPTIELGNINEEFLKKYIQHLQDKGNEGSTVIGRLAFIRKIMNIAAASKLILLDQIPSFDLGIEKATKPRKWISFAEIKLIEDYLDTIPDDSLMATAGWNFITSCYCGLRYGDMRDFDLIKDVIDGRIILRTNKTGSDVSILIHSKLAIALDKLNKVSKLKDNCAENKTLEALRKSLNIKTHITFHVGRHTFAICCAELDIPMEVVQKLLGHTKIETTAIYYRIANKSVDRHMEKWDIKLLDSLEPKSVVAS